VQLTFHMEIADAEILADAVNTAAIVEHPEQPYGKCLSCRTLLGLRLDWNYDSNYDMSTGSSSHSLSKSALFQGRGKSPIDLESNAQTLCS